MDFLEQLRAQKRAGMNEFQREQESEAARASEELRKRQAEEDRRRADEIERDRRKANAVFESLPDVVRVAASKGLGAAVLKEGAVDDRPDGLLPSQMVVVDRQKVYLKGWQIFFYRRCLEEGVVLTVVTEQVDVGVGRLLNRRFHFLAVDLERL